MANDMAQLISGIRKSYVKTNLIDVNLDSIVRPDPHEMLGYRLNNIDVESRKDFKMNFSPIENMFLDRLVSEDVLNRRVNLKKEDFFKGIVYLDYFTNIFSGSYEIIDKIYEVAKEMERQNQELDPDLRVVVDYTARHYMMESMKSFSNTGGRSNSFQRYRQKTKMFDDEYISLKKASPVYQALAKMVTDLVANQDLREKLPPIKRLYDIKAVIFADCIISNLSDERTKTDIIGRIDAGEFYKATLIGITNLSKEIYNRNADRMISYNG